MKFFMLIVLSVGAALLSVWALPMLTEGLVVIRFAGWYVELRMIVALALTILLCLGLWLVVWLWRLPGNVVRTWVEKRAQAQLELGMLALSEGDFAKAEKALTKSAPHSKTPALNYLAAAQAAQGKGQESTRDEYLDQADSSPRARRPVQLTRAELLMASGDLDTSREILETLDKEKPNRPRVLGLLARCYRNAEDWQALAELAPRLKKAEVVDESTADDLERRGFEHGLASAETWEALELRWSKLPKPLRTDPAFAAIYGKAALDLGKGAEVELPLRKMLRKNWSDELGAAWAELPSQTPDKRRKQLQAWLKDHAGNAVVQYAAGKDCAAQQDWEQAINHFAKSLDIEPTPAASEAMGEAAEHTGNVAAAAQAYKQALALQAGREPEPMLLPELPTEAELADDDDEEDAAEGNIPADEAENEKQRDD